MAAYQDQFINQGETFTTQITLDDANSVGYNLYSFSVQSQAKKSYYTSNIALQFTSTIYDPANGIIQGGYLGSECFNIVDSYEA